jgi:hypothetical protein
MEVENVLVYAADIADRRLSHAFFRINLKQAICVYVLFESYLQIISKLLNLLVHEAQFYMRRTLE